MRGLVAVLVLIGTGWSQASLALCPMGAGPAEASVGHHAAATAATAAGHAWSRAGGDHAAHHVRRAPTGSEAAASPAESAASTGESAPVSRESVPSSSQSAPSSDTGCEMATPCGSAGPFAAAGAVATASSGTAVDLPLSGRRAFEPPFPTTDPPPPRVVT